MQDWQNQRLKRQDNKLLALLKRAVPGDFKALHEVHHPAFDVLEIDMEVAAAPPPCEGAIAKLWQADSVPVRTAPFNVAVSSPGEWVVCYDPAMGENSLSALWLFCFCDSVHRLVQAISKQELKEGQMVIKLHRDGQLLAVDGYTIKALVKQYKEN